MIPRIFGQPLWKGRIKRRTAKKHLRRFQERILHLSAQKSYAALGLGDFVNDCTGENGRILEISPIYGSVGQGRGAILLDIDLITENTGCSLCHCGIEPKIPREEVERRMIAYAKGWTLGPNGKYWFGGEDDPKYMKAAERARRLIEIVESGGHITDEDGRLLPEFALRNALCEAARG